MSTQTNRRKDGDGESSSSDSINEDDDVGESDDFLWNSLQEAPDADAPPRRRPVRSAYTMQKPKWWRQRSGRPSPRLKRAIQAMQEYWLEQPPYGETVDWWNGVFPQAQSSQQQLWIEVGFGLGDNLLRLAEQSPQHCFVGSEVHVAGIGTILQRIQDALTLQAKSTASSGYWKGYRLWKDDQKGDVDSPVPTCSNFNTDDNAIQQQQQQQRPYDNLRVYKRDITKLLPHIPDHTVHMLLVTFPDPFFSSNGAQWRLLQADVLVEFHRILALPQGRLYLATDHEGYFGWVHEQMELANTTTSSQLFRPLETVPDRSTWLPVVSKYEEKARAEGRIETFLACWETL